MPSTEDDPRLNTTLTLRSTVRDALDKIAAHENNSRSRIVERLIMAEAKDHPACEGEPYPWLE